MGRSFAEYAFERVGVIQPERDGRGALIEERPESPANLLLHKYGEGPFCRFRIAREDRWRRSGIYVITCGDTVHYVGECQNLAIIWNFVGRITPSAVRYKGGQQTHCRINALILDEARQGVEVILWFHAVEDDIGRSAGKSRLVDALNPSWNRTSTSFPRSSPSKSRVTSGARAEAVSVSSTRPSRKEDEVTLEHSFAGLSFSYIGPIRPERDERGEIIEELPQSKFRNERDLPLHKYGEGPFCQFRVAFGWQQSGIYVLTNGDDPCYVGECQNLEDRWGTTGYGRISPRNCYKGGQETNCRVNNLIYRETKTGAKLALWFHSIDGDKQDRLAVESELVAALKPPWNR